MKTKLYEKLRTARIKSGLSQSELALLCGWDQPRISRIERGETNLTINNLNKILKALGLDKSEGFYFDGYDS